MRPFCLYAKADSNKETIARIIALSRLAAAKYFACCKNLELKEFLKIYSVCAEPCGKKLELKEFLKIYPVCTE